MTEPDVGFGNQAFILALKLGVLAKIDKIELKDLLKFVAQCYYDVEQKLDEVLDIIKYAPEVDIMPGRTSSESKTRSKRILLELSRALTKERKENDGRIVVKI